MTTHDVGPAAAELAELADRAERDYVSYATSFGRVPGITIIRNGELLARRGDPAHDYLTVVLGTWTSEAVLDGLIDRAIETVGGPGRPFTWSIWPSNRPAALRQRLEARGFGHLFDGPLMWLDLDGAQLPDELPAGLSIEQVTDAATLAAAGEAMMPPGAGDDAARRLFGAAYEALILGLEPQMTYFAGWFEGRIVASSAIYTGTGLAGIYAVGTVADLRGRGFGGALTAAALKEGQRRGLRSAALLSSDLGLPVYRQLGFREVGWVTFLGSPPDEVSPAS